MTVTTAQAVRVTLVTAPGCHFCVDAHRELTELAAAGAPIELTVVEATSATGSQLIGTHRPAMNPLVVVEGRYFSAGRFPRRKFQALLRARPTSEGVRHG
jgi:AhpD family alkylhydroperoxidase